MPFASLSSLSKIEKIWLTGLLFFYLLVNLLSSHLPFFWGDSIVQSSIAAQWYYDNNFTHFFLPLEDNPGHPPFFGMYLAIWWKIFGQNLLVSHLAMLPFLLGIAWQFFYIARYFLSGKFLLFALILFAIEPTILAQSTMVTPELPILFLFLLGIRSILYRQIFWQILAMCLIVLINTRGVMLVAVLFLSEILLYFADKKAEPPFREKKGAGRLLLKYIPPGLVAIAWLFVHYFIEGWIGFNRENMPWRNSFIPVSGTGYLRNFAIFGWRLLDFGRIFMWLITGFLFLKMLWHKRKNILQDKKLLQIFALLLPPLLVFFPVMTRYIGTLQHRYLLPFFALFIILVIHILKNQNKNNTIKSRSNFLFVIMVLGLLSGHFWVYPDKVSQGWEASLAHLPYFQVRDNINTYVLKNNLNKNKIATGSPNKYLLMHSDLQKGQEKYLDIDEVKYDTLSYVIYSNIFNDFADSTYNDIHANWKLEYESKRGQVRMAIFKNPVVFD